MSYKTLFWGCFGISLLLFFSPISTGSAGGYGLDKDFHAAIFAALIYSALKAFPNLKLSAFAGLAFYGFTVEYIQGRYFPLRHFDWLDITADITGLLIGSFLYWIFKKKPQTANEPKDF